MITQTSILRRLPVNLDRRQALFLDGIRHAAEMADFSHCRLKDTLTKIAIHETDIADTSQLFTSAFLDAWSIVDVIDRFRALWSLLPNSAHTPPPPGTPTFATLSQPVRDIADHLAQRADYVVARQGAALGALNWFTALGPDGPEGLKGVFCTIVPGTIQPGTNTVVRHPDRPIDLPTGAIVLAAGEYSACLSDVLSGMAMRIGQLEAGLERQLGKTNGDQSQAGADVLIRVNVTFLP